MFSKAMAYIRNFLSVSVSDQNHREFIESLNKINIFRGKMTALMFVFLEFLLLTVTIIIKGGNAFKTPGLYYTLMYLVQLFAMLTFYLFFCKVAKDMPRYYKAMPSIGVFFASFILCWCAGISMLDQMSSGQIMVYVFAVIAVAVAPILKPVALLLIYFFVHTFFIILLTVVPFSELSYGNFINSTAFVIIAWVISLMRYRKQIIEFNNGKLIEEKNLELSRMNIELQKANKKLEKLSKIDGLTGVFNRSMFDITIKSEWNRCKRQFKPLSLLMIDIDFFKAFNDYYGHQAGDECIKQVAKVLSASAKRASDTVARYGGEEFVVVLPYCSKNNAQMLAEQIRKKVEELKIPHVSSDISEYLTISLGVYTATPTNVISIEQFIKNADMALYDAKKRRNNVVMSSQSSSM